jgi:hypothetical protein
VYAACKYFDVLDPILGSRPSVQPRVTNKIIAAGKSLEDNSSAESTGLLSIGNDEVEVTSRFKKRASVATTCNNVVEKVCVNVLICCYYLLGRN